jgi:hypothetical protein
MGRRNDFGDRAVTQIYRYVLTVDGGMAPCSQDGLISLGTCKPMIRKRARENDWVAGFMPGTRNGENRGRLVWVGQISEKLTQDEYRKRYPHRRDAIYGLDANGEYCKYLDRYHCDPAQQRRDHANPVLLFDQARTRYFGGEPEVLQERLMHLAPQGRAYRVNFRRDGDLHDWEEFISKLPVEHGEPRDELVLCPGCRYCSSARQPPKSCGAPKAIKRMGRKKSNC